MPNFSRISLGLSLDRAGVDDDYPEFVLGGVGTTVLEDARGSAVLRLDRDSVNAFLLPVKHQVWSLVHFFCFSKIKSTRKTRSIYVQFGD